MKPIAPIQRRPRSARTTKTFVRSAHRIVDSAAERTIRLPPIVGVPDLLRCASTPSARTTCPTPRLRSRRIVAGPATKTRRYEVTTAPTERKVR